MLKYKFIETIRNSTKQKIPYLVIDYSSIKGYEHNMVLNEILGHLDRETVRAIVKELEQVKAWELDKCIFWFESTLIEVYKEWLESYSWKAFISYEYGDKVLETDLKIEDILQMMKDWKEYIDTWEKQTGMKKI